MRHEVASSEPIRPAVEFLALLSSPEPGARGASVMDFLDELAEGVLAYAEAFSAASALLRTHQPELTVEASDLDAAARGMLQAGYSCRELAPTLRGNLKVYPWREDAPRPAAEATHAKAAGESAEAAAASASRESTADTEGEAPIQAEDAGSISGEAPDGGAGEQEGRGDA